MIMTALTFLGIPQTWHRASSIPSRVRPLVQLAEMGVAITRILIRSCLASKGPTDIISGVKLNDIDGLLQALEDPSDEYTMRPWAGVVNVENVTVGLSRELGLRVCFHPPAEARLRSSKLSVLIGKAAWLPFCLCKLSVLPSTLRKKAVFSHHS